MKTLTIPESAMQELRYREGQTALWEGNYRSIPDDHPHKRAYLNLWETAQQRMNGAYSMLIALYGDDVIDLFTRPQDPALRRIAYEGGVS